MGKSLFKMLKGVLGKGMCKGPEEEAHVMSERKRRRFHVVLLRKVL